MKGIYFESIKTKALTANKKIERLESAPLVCIPLFEHKGISAVPVVKVDEKVLKGQLIAKANGKFSVNVFSSVSGTVHMIEERMDDTGKKGLCVTIINDFENKTQKFTPVKKITPKSINQAVFDAGIIGLSGSRYPTHLKLDPSKKITQLLINGAECENYLTCDDALMQNYAKEVIEGAKLCAKVFSLKKFTVAIQNDKKQAISQMKKEAEKHKGFEIEIKIVPTKYPIGFEKYLIEKAFGLKLGQMQYPAEKGICVLNIATCYAVFEAVKKGKPLFERVVTVSGLAVEKTANYIVPNGATFSSILNEAKKKFEDEKLTQFEMLCEQTFSGFEDDKDAVFEAKSKFLNCKEDEKKELKKQFLLIKKQAKQKKKKAIRHLKNISEKLQEEFKFALAKVVAGGTMMGKQINNLEIGIGRATGGALFLTSKEVDFSKPKECINCGMCSSVCNAGLYPNKIEQLALKGDFEGCRKFNIGGCIGCGCCTYICPARRKVLENITGATQIQKGGENANR